jgi:hypothetical protein
VVCGKYAESSKLEAESNHKRQSTNDKPRTTIRAAGVLTTPSVRTYLYLQTVSTEICSFVEQELQVPQNRIFVDFRNLERSMFGWDGKTF